MAIAGLFVSTSMTLPTSIKLDRKGSPWTNTLAYLAVLARAKKKCFLTAKILILNFMLELLAKIQGLYYYTFYSGNL